VNVAVVFVERGVDRVTVNTMLRFPVFPSTTEVSEIDSVAPGGAVVVVVVDVVLVVVVVEVVVVLDVVVVEVVVVLEPGPLQLSFTDPAAPPHPSTAMWYVTPAVTDSDTRLWRFDGYEMSSFDARSVSELTELPV
jgi:hypothetical protein